MKHIRHIIFFFPLSLVLLTVNLQAQLVVNPNNYEFSPQQIRTSSELQSFTATNNGDDPITLNPEQIQIQGQNGQSVTLSVLSYNIETDDGNWPGRFAYMLEEIREMDADIIGLQEVIQRANLDNQAMQMADSLGFYYYFDSVDDENNVHRYGNAIVSRYPIEETNFRALVPLDRYRKALHARVNVLGNTVDVYNTHLHHRPLDHHIRIEQVLDLLDFIEETSTSPFVFITGDFNANPDWEEMVLLYDDFMDVYPIFHENHMDPEHATLNYKLGHQMRRIDYVLFGKSGLGDLVPLSAEIVLNDEHEDDQMESDHFGVFARFEILADDSHFTLHKPNESVELQPGTGIDLQVAFSPHSPGTKQILLVVGEDEAIITGEAFDATIHSFPYSEDFATTAEFELPLGWTANSPNWYVFNADHAGGEAPELVFWWQPDAEGSFYARTPPMNTAGLDSITLSFRHAANDFQNTGGYDLRLVSIAGEEQFTILEWDNPGEIPATEVETTLYSDLHGVGSDMLFLAWIYEGPSTSIVRWAIDDLEVTALPALAVTPSEFSFGEQQIHTQSDSVAFTLTNIGGGSIQLTPGDISISGADASQFLLEGLSQAVTLEHGDTETVYIVFAPQQTGEINAQLLAGSKTIHLLGESYDPTITQLPWHEDFSQQVQGGVPRGWQSDTRNWEAFMLSNAGGTPPEMVFWWEPVKTGRFYLKTPEIVTTDKDTLVLSFKYRVRNFENAGIYTLSVVAIADGVEHIIHQWEDPDFIEATEFMAIIDAENHGVGSESFRLAWVFEGTTNNLISWDFDDITLEEPGDEPIPEVTPDAHDFGQHPIDNVSEPFEFTLRNRGGNTWNVSPDDITLNGEHASDFLLSGLQETTELALLETATIEVAFKPTQQGERTAELHVQDIIITLSGWGSDPSDYFIYSDFTIPGFTNVEGFREIPGWAQGSINASDISGEGEYGGVVLELDYDLSLTDDLTGYWLWAFPSADISGFDHIVLYVRANEPVENARLQVFDTDGIQGNDGAAYTHFNIGTEWHKVSIPLSDFVLMDFADNLPDMSHIQRVDILMEKDNTTPQQAIIHVDMVGFSTGDVSVPRISTTANISMFPNPASQTVTIASVEEVKISVIDLSGKVLIKKESQQEQTLLDISGLKSGIYLVRVQSKNGIIVQKLSVR